MAKDQELVELIKSICQSEMQRELHEVRADILRLKLKLDEVKIVKSSPRISGNRECSLPSLGLPWESLKEERQVSSQQRSLRRQSSAEDTSGSYSLVEGDLERINVTVTGEGIDGEVANEEYREIMRKAQHEFDINFDVWGASTLAIVQDFPAVVSGNFEIENLLRIGTILLCLAVNLFLQFMFLYWVTALVMLPNINEIQDTYRTFHLVAFENSGSFDTEAFHSLGKDELDKICGMAISSPLFMSACLSLWVARCFNEVRSIWRRKHTFSHLPQLPSGVSPVHMAHEVSLQVGDSLQESKYMIVCLNTTARVMFDLLIVLPRMLVACVLVIVGTAFLSASLSYDDLILNALCMEFIFDIDELIFRVFLPLRVTKNIDNTKVITPPSTHEDVQAGLELDEKEIIASYRKSIYYFFYVLAIPLSWYVLQPILPGFQHDISKHCAGYLSSVRDVSCKFWEKDCFPK